MQKAIINGKFNKNYYVKGQALEIKTDYTTSYALILDVEDDYLEVIETSFGIAYRYKITVEEHVNKYLIRIIGGSNEIAF